MPEKERARDENRWPSDDLGSLNLSDDMGFPPSDIGEKKFNWGSVASILCLLPEWLASSGFGAENLDDSLDGLGAKPGPSFH